MSDTGGDGYEDEDDPTARVRVHRWRSEPPGTERLLAEEEDEGLTDLLFGEEREPPSRNV